MSYASLADIEAKVEREIQEERERKKAREAARKVHLARLFGSADRLDWQRPAPLERFDTLLGRHAAQLDNLVSLSMEPALDDDTPFDRRMTLVTAITRMVQANAGIARVFDKRARSKTVHGGVVPGETQD